MSTAPTKHSAIGSLSSTVTSKIAQPDRAMHVAGKTIAP